VKNLARSNCILLDAGCGKGDSIACQLSNVELVGVDVLRSNIAVCKSRWRSRTYVVADVTMLPFIKDSFGGALSADVIEHIKDKSGAMNELSRVTQQGGFFVACTSNVLNPIFWLDTKFQILMKPLVIKYGASGHYERHSRLSPSGLLKILNSSRYRMDSLYILGYPLFSQTKDIPGGLVSLWVLFNRLTQHRPLLYLKEALVWQATRV
jgi:ubiquinone/menaquinone biosynthesis C-methylase UbiE